jgi:hypothetical protein
MAENEGNMSFEQARKRATNRPSESLEIRPCQPRPSE